MASDPQMELRVSRHEVDSYSIYDLISEIRSTQHEHSRRFDSIEATLNEVVRRLPDSPQAWSDRVRSRTTAGRGRWPRPAAG